MELAADDIRHDVDAEVTKHLNSESMKQVISSNALDSFTKICDAKTLAMIEKLEETARDIRTEAKWITKYIQAVAMNAVANQKDNVQKLMKWQINSKLSQNLINRLAKEACNCQALVSVNGFADKDHKKQDVDTAAQSEPKGDKTKRKMFNGVSWNMKGKVETSSDNVER